MPHRKTCKRYNEVGHAHSLTFSCFQRQPFLVKDRSREWVVQGIQQAQEKLQFDVWAYVIMPEHVHLLIWPREKEYDISPILSSIKQSVTKRALLYVRKESPWFLPRMADIQPNGKVHYRFWQRGGGYDRNVFEPFAVHEQIAYLHNNPVRRGLCIQPEDWYWSSAADYLGVRVDPLKIAMETVPPLIVVERSKS